MLYIELNASLATIVYRGLKLAGKHSLKRFLFWIAVIAAIYGCIYGLSFFRPQIEIQLDALSERFGVDIRESVLTRGVMTIIMTPILGIPVFGAIFALISMGTDSTDDDLFGAQVHRLRTGARILIVVACCGFFALSAFLGWEAFNGENALLGSAFLAISAAVCLLMIFILIWGFRYYVKIDQLMVEGVTLTMSKISMPISKLERIERNEQALEYHLHFEEGERIRVSFFIRGLEKFLTTLGAKLEELNA